MSSSVTTKTILITGASSGLGQAIALTLAAAGYRVFGTSRKPQAEQGDPTNPVRMLQLDVTNDASINACLKQLLKQAPGIDVLINNAGNGLAGAIEDCANDEVEWQMATNFLGPLRMMHKVLPLMREQGHGRIITIGSLAGHIGLPYQGIYSASKHALEGINEALRMELRGSGIDATILCPGDFKTGFVAERIFARNADSPAHAAQMRKTVSIYEHDEIHGASPEQVGRIVKRLVESKSLRVRYFVGRFDQRFSVLLKQLMPASWFEFLLRRIYKLP